MAYDRDAITASVRQLLRSNPRLSLRAIAVDLGIDRHTISRALIASTGQPFREIRTAIEREMYAEALRTSGTRSIKEIASQFGHTHSRSFARRWKQMTGMAPSQSRRKR